jgi:hypothetical protein
MLESFFRRPETVDAQRHGALRYRPVARYDFARTLTTAPLGAGEIVTAARDYPVVFTDDGRSLPVALLTLDRQHSPLVDDDGRWLGGYLPAHLRRYPFILGDDAVARRYVLMLDREAPQLTAGDEGEPLFVGAGQLESEVLRRARAFLATYQRDLQDCEQLLRPLRSSGVLQRRSLTRSVGDRTELAVRGFRVVDEQALAALPDATLGSWLRSGLLGMVLAHLRSLHNVQRLEAGRVEPAVAKG